MLGFYVTGHPLDQYREKVKDLATHDSSNLEGLAKGVEVAICGVLTTIVRKRNREGKPWLAMQLEDLSGSVEALLFTTQYERLGPMVEEDRAVLVRGLVLPEENAPPKISVQEIVPLEVARVPLPSLISIKVRLGRNGGSEPASALQELFQKKPGETEVRFRLELPRDFSVILDVPVKVRPDREFREALEKICGADAIEVLAS
jgi:DNA polymerase-3 subunit alpha